ncbi:hypothetical protein [Mesorhizobium sp.]|uniref:phage head-tail joining protein n=1 Tax=Mesorhizobium sp. TaxID=1871066 RepID=UPI00122A4224|nr:hypothetical protein [Mesorhizobium sp.]TIN84344.1 MAG: hypothetical protein E5X97_22510 [Mesorhizobium sp.]
MATYTQGQLDAIKKAYASGVLTVKHGDTLSTFRSLDEMERIINRMEAEVNGVGEPPRRTVAGFSRGL